MKAKVATVMGYSRWLQYVHFFFPEISLVRPNEDECDGCYAINTELSNENITPERKAELELLKQTHIGVVVAQ